MKFLVDAQLPRRLCEVLEEYEHDAIHTLDLNKGNATTDHRINALSIEEHRVVITKDADFVNSMILNGEPYKLLLISTGNIRNRVLFDLIRTNMDILVELLEQNTFIELNQDSLSVHF